MPMIRSRSILWTATICAVLLFGWFAGLISFADRIPTEASISSQKTDAIVVLTGGSERIATGIGLLSSGAAERLFISSVGSAVRVDNLLSPDLPNRDTLASKMILGTQAVDTAGNAAETAAWVRQADLKSIRLVTAAYHMPRSLREFERSLPDILIVPHPVFPEQVKKDWWRYPGTASLVAQEYTKYLFSGLRNWRSTFPEDG